MSHVITRIAVQGIAGAATAGLKSHTFDMTLGGVDVVCGPNGAGKTTRLIALLGAMSGLAQTTTDRTRPYVGGGADDAEVVVETTGGGWRRDLGITNPNAGLHKQATRDAEAIVGAPVVSWDLADWSASTDGQRRKLLGRIAQAGGQVEAWTSSDAQDRLHLAVQGVDTAPDLVNTLIGAHPRAADAAVWLDAAELWSIATATGARGDLRDAEARLKERKENAGQLPAGDRATLTANLDKARQQKAASDGAVDNAARHAAALIGAQNDLAGIVTAGKEARDADAPPAPSPAGVTLAQKRLADAKAQTPPAVDSPSAGGPDLAALDKAATDAWTARALTAAAKHDADVADRAACDRMNVLNVAHGEYATAVTLKAAQEAKPATRCIHCGVSYPLGDEVVVELPPKPEPRARLAAETQVAKAAYAAAWKADTEIITAAEEATRAALIARTTADALTGAAARVKNFDADKARSIASAEANLKTAIQHHDAAMAAYHNENARRVVVVKRLRIEWTTAKNKVSRLESATVASVDPDAAQQVADHVSFLQVQVDAWRDHDRAVAALKLAGEELTGAIVHRQAADAIVEGIRSVRLAQAAACYGPVEAAARAVLAGAWEGAPLPYLKGPGDYGAILRGVPVRFEALSESEKRITAAALVCALATVANQPCRLVLIDGLEVVQSDHRPLLLLALARAKAAGLVDNVLITSATANDAEADALDLPGVTLHRLDPR